jgi:hypothetical protein
VKVRRAEPVPKFEQLERSAFPFYHYTVDHARLRWRLKRL